MKSIVIYYSESGNTKKIAKTIATSVGAELKRIEDIKEEDVWNYDLIFIGTPIHSFGPATPVKTFLQNLPQMPGKKGAAFCTMHTGGDQRTFNIIKKEMETKKISFIDGFSSLGQSRIIANFGPRIFNRGRPNKNDLKAAEEFGKRVSNIAQQRGEKGSGTFFDKHDVINK